MSQDGPVKPVDESVHVVDFNEARAQKMDEKRRQTERIFFKQMLGVYCVTEEQNGSQLRSIEPIDVSEEGLSFQVPHESKNPWPKDAENLSLRLYFSQDTYLPIRLKIVNSRAYIENGTRYVRYGCAIDSTAASYPAYRNLVGFMKAYAEHARKDLGDVTLFYL